MNKRGGTSARTMEDGHGCIIFIGNIGEARPQTDIIGIAKEPDFPCGHWITFKLKAEWFTPSWLVILNGGQQRFTPS